MIPRRTNLPRCTVSLQKKTAVAASPRFHLRFKQHWQRRSIVASGIDSGGTMSFPFSPYGRFMGLYGGCGLFAGILGALLPCFVDYLPGNTAMPISFMRMAGGIWKLSLVPMILTALLAVVLHLRRCFWHGFFLTVTAASIHFISLLRIFPVCIFPVSGNDCSDFAIFVNAMLYAFCCAVAVAGFVFLLPKG